MINWTELKAELQEVILVAEVATPEGKLLGKSIPSMKRNLKPFIRQKDTLLMHYLNVV